MGQQRECSDTRWIIAGNTDASTNAAMLAQTWDKLEQFLFSFDVTATRCMPTIAKEGRYWADACALQLSRTLLKATATVYNPRDLNFVF